LARIELLTVIEQHPWLAIKKAACDGGLQLAIWGG
jgi:hypothetical protein